MRPDHRLAYLVLERARLGCEAQLEAHPPRAAARALRAAHRHLGLAGYLASDHLEAGERQELLGAARAGAPAPGEAIGEELLLLAMHGARIASRCVRDASCGPEMHQARLHAVDAVLSLGTLVGAGRWHDVVRAAMERREFDPTWERTRLLR